MKLKDFLTAYKNKDFTFDGCLNAWYDWFCSDAGLTYRTQRAAGIIKKVFNIIKKDGCDPDEVDVSFKNCCPMVGPLYDCVRFFTGKDEVCICLAVADGRADHFYELYNYGETDKPVFGSDKAKGVAEAIAAEIKKVLK